MYGWCSSFPFAKDVQKKMKFSPMAVVACMLCVGILALGFNSPQQSRLDADEIAQKKSDISATEQMARDLMESLKNQQTLNQKLTEADNRTIEVIAGLQESIARLGAHVKDSVPTREEVTRLVSTKSESASDDDTTCSQKVEQLQKELIDLKARVEVLELTRATAAKAPASAAAAASSYGTVTSSPVVVMSSGGSTGSSVRSSSGGSTGSVRSTVSYGSTGSSNAQYSQPVQYYSEPVVQYSQPVVSSPVVVAETVVTTSDDSGCYIDENGNKVCPQRSQSSPRDNRVLFPNARWNK
jgi:hypothetical protein